MTTPSSCSQHPSPPSCTPKLHLAQPYESHLAEEAAQVGKMAGYELLPWQRNRLEDWSAIGPDGKWVHKRIGDSVPRQSGKSVDGIIWATFAASAMGYEARLFDTERVHTIDIVMDDWDSFLETCENEEYAPCSVVLDNEAYQNAGLRAKGNTARPTGSQVGSDRIVIAVAALAE